MKQLRRVMCSLAVIALAAGAAAVDHGMEIAPYPTLEPSTTPVSPEALEAAARSRELEIGSAKNFGGTSPLVIPAAAFTTNGNYDNTYFFHVFTGAMRGLSSTDGCVQAPVYLPQGAEVYQVYASILDQDAGSDVYVTLMRSDNLAYHDADQMAGFSTSGSSSIIQTPSDATINFPAVSYPDYHYWVSLCLPSADTQLYSVRIYFNDLGIFSDGFESGGTSAWTTVMP